MKMYRIEPIIKHDLPIDLPNCMFKMKNVLARYNTQPGEHVSSVDRHLDISEQTNAGSEINALQTRQESIIKQLEDLKEQMLNLKHILNVSNTDLQSDKSKNQNDVETDTKINLAEIKKLSDFVINVNPSNPPYSLLILQRLWANSLKLVVKSYLHSTVKQLPGTASELVAELEKHEVGQTVPQILVRLIWKNVDEKMELITATSSSTPICGETNILRYLSRVGPNNFNYELLENPCEIDSALDICYLLSKARTKTERHLLLQLLNSKLGKSLWICNRDNISIADIAANSVIKQVASEVNVNLTKWMQRCEKV